MSIYFFTTNNKRYTQLFVHLWLSLYNNLFYFVITDFLINIIIYLKFIIWSPHFFGVRFFKLSVVSNFYEFTDGLKKQHVHIECNERFAVVLTYFLQISFKIRHSRTECVQMVYVSAIFIAFSLISMDYQKSTRAAVQVSFQYHQSASNHQMTMIRIPLRRRKSIAFASPSRRPQKFQHCFCPSYPRFSLILVLVMCAWIINLWYSKLVCIISTLSIYSFSNSVGYPPQIRLTQNNIFYSFYRWP